ncbi:hypothetical protein GGI25_005543 [Coemansia spiralis]|uniref:Uncharacterized protein n=2 Tax=Coemansia TaxID=4863 RepID=A0A9W8G4C9_9FUNG|nr:hypothetical protein EDC05_005589 [Coemansia umbellata]KAJ2671300.1 hypothetical protein GGI25_005543 [Coemansia spiralis]
MTPGSRISKLSSHFKGYLSGFKRRKRHSDSDTESTGAGGLDIVHVSMENARHHYQPQAVNSGYVEVPMSYWFTPSDDEDDASNRDSPNRSREVVSDSTANIGTFVPLRLPPSLPHKDTKQRYSQDEWQEKAEEAVFGSFRTRTDKLANAQHMPQTTRRKSKRMRKDDVHETTNGWTISTNEPAKSPQNNSGVMESFLSLSSSTSPPFASPTDQCANALNELLFATNARVDSALHDLPQKYIDGRTIGRFARDFSAVVSQAYDDFVAAAKSVLSIATQMLEQRSQATAQAGLLGTLLAEIVAGYADQAARTHTLYNDNYSIYSSDDLESSLNALSISIVKYSKEELRIYAATSISKYVSSQVLLSTGIENDLVDNLADNKQAMSVVMEQIKLLESMHGPPDTQDPDADLEKLRRKAARWDKKIRQLQNDIEDASYIRKTFETILLEVQPL